MFVEPMGQTPHTAVASLTVAFANPLAHHRLECTLEAIRGFAFGVARRRGDLSCLTVGAENLLHGTLAEPERLRHPPHGVLRGDRWPLATFVIEIFLQLHDNLTFPPINSLALRHRVVSWRASMRHSCETTISGYTTCLFGAKSCETRYKPTLYRRASEATHAPWRGLHTSKRVHSRPKAPLAVFPPCLLRAVAAGRRHGGTRTGQRKMAFG